MRVRELFRGSGAVVVGGEKLGSFGGSVEKRLSVFGMRKVGLGREVVIR